MRAIVRLLLGKPARLRINATVLAVMGIASLAVGRVVVAIVFLAAAAGLAAVARIYPSLTADHD